MHLSDPERSGITVYSFADFNRLGDKQFQDLLARQVVVVTGAQVSPYTFDEAGFSALYPLHNHVVIEGMLQFFAPSRQSNLTTVVII